VRAQLLVVAGRAAPLKVTHHCWIDTGGVNPKRLQPAIKQIRRCFVPGGKSAKIGGRNSEILRHPRQLRRVAPQKLINRGSLSPQRSNGFGNEAC